MAYESNAEPIKLGYLFDFVLPDGFPQDMRADLTQTFDIVFEPFLARVDESISFKAGLACIEIKIPAAGGQ